jgi:hypothetical protein
MKAIEAITENPVVSSTVSFVKTSYAWVTARLWPVFTAGMVVSAICVIATSHEKQLLADHLYGSNGALRADEADETLRKANALFDDELSRAVKADVWALSSSQFRAEYNARHGSA